MAFHFFVSSENIFKKSLDGGGWGSATLGASKGTTPTRTQEDEMEKALLLVVNEFDAIKDAIIEYRMGNLDNHYALVNAIIARNGVEMWQYIEASDTVQNATGLNMFEKFEVIEKPKFNWNTQRNAVEGPDYEGALMARAEMFGDWR